MAAISPFRYLIVLSTIIIYFRTISAESESSFDFKNFTQDSNFESKLALYGYSKVVNGGLSIEITGSAVSSAGRIIFKKPIKLLEGKPPNLVSFSTYFSFSMSPGDGDGLAFVMVPISFPLNDFDGGSFGLLGKRKLKCFSVEFDTSKDETYGDVNGNHVGIDVSSFASVKVSNVSSINLVLNSGEKLQAWIDYEATSKRVEVRLSKIGHPRPLNPLLSYSIDMSHLWKEDEVFVGLSASNGNASQWCKVHSWSFKPRKAPEWMHSQPLDPEAFVEDTKAPAVHKRTDCFLRVLSALVFGTGVGALGAFFVLFAWTIFWGTKRPIVPVLPEDYAAQPVELEYKNFKVVIDKHIEDGKK